MGLFLFLLSIFMWPLQHEPTDWAALILQIEEAIAEGQFTEAGQLAGANLSHAKAEELDTVISRLYFAQAISHFRADPNQGLPFLDSAIRISQQSPDLSFTIRLYNAKSSFQKKVGDLQKAKQTSVEAYKYARESAPEYLFLSARNSSVSYRLLGRYDSALYYILVADSAVEDEKQKYLSLQGISNIYLEMNQPSKALPILKQLTTMSETVTDEMFSWLNLGRALMQVQGYDSAISALENAKSLAEQVNDQIELSNIYGYLGKARLETGNPEQARPLLEKSISLALPSSPADILSSSYLNLAALQIEKGEYRVAQLQAIRAFELAKSEELFLLQMKACKQMAQISRALGNHEEAYEWLEQHLEIKDKVNQEERVNIIENLTAKYEASKKEQEIQLLSKSNAIQGLQIRQQKTVGLVVGLFLLLLGVLGLFFYRQSKIKNDWEKAQLEQQLLRSQMNPHFIFNALASIQAFILEQQSKEAARYLGQFADLTRDILESSREAFVPIGQEVRMIRNYAALESLRFSKKIELELDLDENLDPEFDSIPPLFLQPFVENAFKHGFKNKDSGVIRIEMKASGKYMEVQVSDDGVGMDATSGGHRSLAMEIVRGRLHLLAKKYPISAELIIQPATSAGGLQISFQLPLSS